MKKPIHKNAKSLSVLLILFYFTIALFTSCEINSGVINSEYEINFSCKSIILGDSITAGHEWKIDSFGASGKTVEWMYYNHPDLSRYEDIFILMGINNLAEGDGLIHIKTFMNYFNEKFTDKNFYIISVLPIDEDQRDFTTNEEIEELNSLLSEVSPVINIYDSMIDVYGNNPYTRDGVHLTDTGYIILEDILYSYVDF